MMVVIERTYSRTAAQLFAALALVFTVLFSRVGDAFAAGATSENAASQLTNYDTPELRPVLGDSGSGTGYGEGGYYGQSYYQAYYQSYYQGTYQGSYVLTVTQDTLISANAAVTGVVSKASGSFVIDDPLDPKNKLLYHSFVESPDAKNIYDGIVVLNKDGEARVNLPSYFEALNKDVRYQVKPIGAAMPNLYIKEEEHENFFVIGGGVPGEKVSWQVTGVRHDTYIEANPIIPVVEKSDKTLVPKGAFLYPAGYEHTISELFGPLKGVFSKLLGK